MIAAPAPSLSSLPSPFRRPSLNPNPRRRASTISAAAFAPATTTSTASLYDVLGLPAGASVPEIKAAYRRIARSCHPDVVAFDHKETSADFFMRVNDAYSTLSDPNKRAEYDRELVLLSHRRVAVCRTGPFASPRSTPGAGTSPFTTPAASYSGFRRRTWETDQCW